MKTRFSGHPIDVGRRDVVQRPTSPPAFHTHQLYPVSMAGITIKTVRRRLVSLGIADRRRVEIVTKYHLNKLGKTGQ